MITERDIAVLLMLARYYVPGTGCIQSSAFPDSDGRIARRRIQTLVEAADRPDDDEVVNPLWRARPLVYFPSRKGCDFAEYTGDDQYLLTAIADAAAASLVPLAGGQRHAHRARRRNRSANEVSLVEWVQHGTRRTRTNRPSKKRYRIYTLIHEQPRLVCAPDAAFLPGARTFQGLPPEQDRNTSAFTKSRVQDFRLRRDGRATTASLSLSNTTPDGWRSPQIAPTERRRDALKRALRDKPGVAPGGSRRFPSHPDRFLSARSFIPATAIPCRW